MALTKKKFQAMIDAAKKSFETPVRKSRGLVDAVAKKGEEYFSIAKYVRGAKYNYWQDADYEKSRFIEVNKQFMSGATGVGGGFAVTPEYNQELIELLINQVVVRSMGPRVYNLAGNTMFFSRKMSASTGFWVAEGAVKTPSVLTLGQASLVLKEVAGLVLCSNDLIADANIAIDGLIKNDLMEQLSLSEDLAFIAGTGGPQPLGIYNDPLVPTTTLGGGNGAIPQFDDLKDLMYTLQIANVVPSAWLMHPRTKNTLEQLKDGNGRYIYTSADLDRGDPDRLLGLPVYFSNQIPINLTFGASAANCSYLILGNWNEFTIGDKAGSGIVLDVSDQRYFEFDQTAIRAVKRVDCMVRQPNAFQILRGILP